MPRRCPGNRFTEQAFEYDALDNIIHVSTLFTDASRNLTTFSFTPADPCQLTQGATVAVAWL